MRKTRRGAQPRGTEGRHTIWRRAGGTVSKREARPRRYTHACATLHYTYLRQVPKADMKKNKKMYFGGSCLFLAEALISLSLCKEDVPARALGKLPCDHDPQTRLDHFSHQLALYLLINRHARDLGEPPGRVRSGRSASASLRIHRLVAEASVQSSFKAAWRRQLSSGWCAQLVAESLVNSRSFTCPVLTKSMRACLLTHSCC
jgi:hypothetical protein